MMTSIRIAVHMLKALILSQHGMEICVIHGARLQASPQECICAVNCVLLHGP